MFSLPLELQLLTVESITDTDTLVALYDSLPSMSDTMRDLLLHRIFKDLHEARIRRLETLRECLLAVFELRDWTGDEVLSSRFQALVDGVNEEIDLSEQPVEFRGLRHPSQGRTMLKKENMRERAGSTSPKSLSKRYLENMQNVRAKGLTSDAHAAAKQMWNDSNGQVCLKMFMHNLYQQQLAP